MAGGFDQQNPYAQNNGGFMNNSQTSPGGAAKGASNTSIRAVTVRQILNAQQAHAEAEITVDGLEIGQVTFVGIIRNLAENATNTSYNIEDGTGTVEVRAWLDNSATKLMDDEFKTDHYVRIIGQIKTFQNRRTITAGHIRTITDFNEIFYHKLDVVNTHLQITKGSSLGAGAGNGAGQNDMNGVQAYEDILSKLYKPLQRSIMKTIFDLRTDDENHGVAISVVVRRTQGSNEKEVRAAVDDLVGEGFLYSAEDDEHVLPTM